MNKIPVILVAAGEGTRFGGEIPKVYRPLCGIPLVEYSLRLFAAHPLVLVVHPAHNQYWQPLKNRYPDLKIIMGGGNRSESVYHGLQAVAGYEEVLIHDAARPLLHPDDLKTLLQTQGAAILARPLNDSLKRVEGTHITDHPSRDGLWCAETPQKMPIPLLLEFLGQGLAATDEATLLTNTGHTVAVVKAQHPNPKLTHPEDLSMMEQWMRGQGKTRTISTQGIDVHAFGTGTHVILGGITIPHSHSLIGHSDADVVLHAVADALFAATASGDIGTHFPPSDVQWRGTNSEIFVQKACELLKTQGGIVQFMDITILCESPKISPYRVLMQENIARILCISPTQIAVKATTTERLGFLGRGDGIAALALASVEIL
jgi:2-C-methyl-D-erythritol 4-phosphate cytidylyltransferase / 2-C-methyl-D-erythritol 2,4-cyclodiphosphate synthase